MTSIVHRIDSKGRRRTGRFVTVERALPGYPRHPGIPHEFEMVEINYRECACGSQQQLEWDHHKSSRFYQRQLAKAKP